ncbi:type III pantothenate kinase [Sulfurivermis fontis]|uniref:type III pantothenate kinase n=1 Tax=Sulfurivermis fontis TaxID=1972068 RepID=UPI000FDB4A61|nr:type III pantothenate kinase [Sulfurivermis fontis]
MILLLDIGNTRIKWARLAHGRRSAETPVTHRGRDVALLLSDLWHDLPSPQRVVAACVAGESLRAVLTAWCLEHWGVRPEYLVAAMEACGIRNGYRLPAQLGVDRWLSMIGARQLPEASGQPLCVVGCGTALTVDMLSVTGQHLGGWIAPGVGLMRQQLEQGTAVFAEGIARSGVEDDFGHDSMEAAATGTAQAAAGMVMQAMSLVRNRHGISPVCVLTGGDASWLQPLLPMPVHVSQELVLSGMAVLLREEEGRYSP